MVQEPAPAGKPANKEESYILTEGQRQGAIEVIEINVSAKQPTVKIKNDGNVSVLTFEKINLPQAPASAPPALAGAPGAPGQVHTPNMIPPPGGGGYNPQNRFNNNSQPVGYNSGVNPNLGGGNPNAVGGLTTIPTRTTRSGGYGYDAQQQQMAPPSHEEQVINMNLQHMANPNFPPPPINLNNNNGGGGPPGLPQ